MINLGFPDILTIYLTYYMLLTITILIYQYFLSGISKISTYVKEISTDSNIYLRLVGHAFLVISAELHYFPSLLSWLSSDSSGSL